MILVKFDIGTLDSTGMFCTRYSNYAVENFNDKNEATVYAKGLVKGLEYKWKRAACHVRFDDGTTEYFY